MKPLKLLTATVALGALLTTPAMADVSTEIYYNDELLNTTQPVVNVEGRVLLAFRDLFENLDGQVSWDDKFRMASVTYGKNTINLFPDTGAVQVNGVPQSLAVGPQIINDRVYLPLRFVAQSLGGTVDYSKGPNGTGIIQIHTIDSTQNYAQKEGNITKILRTTSNPVCSVQPTAATQAAYQQWQQNNSVYFADDHGNLIEVQSYDRSIQVNIIDSVNAKVESKVYDAGVLYPALTSVTKEGNFYNVGINETASSRYAGVGRPTDSSYETVLDTEMGNLTVYNSRNTDNVFRFDASADSSSGVTVANQAGKVLDLAQRISNSKNNSYAVLADGTYGFLMDGHLVILDRDNDIKEDIVLTRTAGDSNIFAVGNRFVVITVEKGMNNPEIYGAVYRADGSSEYYFHDISRISRVADGEKFYDYSNLRIADMKAFGNTIYMLAKTDMDYYLITYNTSNNTSTKEMFNSKEKNYQGFIYTMDGVKLFAADNDYFYLRDVD